MKIKDDIFQWANSVDAVKDEMDIDLFVFTKNYTVYSLAHNPKLAGRLRQLFLLDIIGTVQTGAATGMAVRDIYKDDNVENAIDFVPVERVVHGQEVIEQIAFGESTIDVYREADHKITKMHGMIARFTFPKDSRVGHKKPFYVFKQLQTSSTMTRTKALEIDANSTLDEMVAQAAITIRPGCETVAIGETIFVFNLARFTTLFKYDVKKRAALDGVIGELNKAYKLSFPEGLSMHALAYENAALADKLLRCTPGLLTQEQIVEQADEFGLALMTDDADAIIIMDKRDATMFANLLNDDYVDSNATGTHYLAIKKKEVYATEDRQLNTGL